MAKYKVFEAVMACVDMQRMKQRRSSIYLVHGVYWGRCYEMQSAREEKEKKERWRMDEIDR